MLRQEYLKNVTSLKLDVSKCNACRMCTVVCPHSVFRIENKKAIITDKDLCMECGACMKNCSENAISVKIGVGCAAAIIIGFIKGSEPNCDCSSSNCC